MRAQLQATVSTSPEGAGGCGPWEVLQRDIDHNLGLSFPRHSRHAGLATTEHRTRLLTFNIAAIQPLGALIAGVLTLLVPRLLKYVVAIYLMATGIICLWPRLFHHIPH